jgi:hypothetical protein
MRRMINEVTPLDFAISCRREETARLLDEASGAQCVAAIEDDGGDCVEDAGPVGTPR